MGDDRPSAPAAHLFLAGGGPFAGLVSLHFIPVEGLIAIRGVAPALRVGGGVGERDGGGVDGAGVAQRTAVRPGGGLGQRFPLKRGRIVEEQIAEMPFGSGAAGKNDAHAGAIGRTDGAGGVGGDFAPHRLFPTPFLPGKLKNAVDADPGNAGFSVGQPALLGGDKAAENAALPVIDGVIPLVAVLAGGPGFGFGKGVGPVDAAIEGLAPVFGQGFQDGRGAVGVGKGLPVDAVPRDGPGSLGYGCPPPLLHLLEQISQGRLRCFAGTWLFPLR